MRPLLLRQFSVRHRRNDYRITLQAVGQEPVWCDTDGNLGQIMSGISVLCHGIRVMHQGGEMPEPVILRGTVELSEFRVEGLTVLPFRWKMRMQSGPYRFEANIDSSLEHVLDACNAAMKFFAQKYGVVEVFPDVTRNRDRAGEMGLLEGHA